MAVEATASSRARSGSKRVPRPRHAHDGQEEVYGGVPGGTYRPPDFTDLGRPEPGPGQ